ncbi:unnamed protein product [Diabrotica balteata]|uniref:Uncharacterized protein n=1 Tax=Diabrotica balteata TaxID=107213 RepID=A0A9N9STL1_DIABA|nr:unnamed protein product [Diabrotica balteata]
MVNLLCPFKQYYKQNTKSERNKITQHKTKRYKLHLLFEPSNKHLFEARLEKKLNEVKRNIDIEQEYNNLKTIIKQIAYEVLGAENNDKKHHKPP